MIRERTRAGLERACKKGRLDFVPITGQFDY